jgi:hypothetical protein
VYGLYRAPAAQQAVETPVQTHTPRPPAAEKPTSTPTPQQVTDDIPKPTLDAGLASILETTQIDEQGAIIVEITPINSSEARNSLNFNVKLTTHSIDLTMDLTKLTTLSTDSGAPVQAILWNGPRGGHHIEGILTFPSFSGNQTLLAGATKLTIKIQDLDVPERTFTWNLQK